MYMQSINSCCDNTSIRLSEQLFLFFPSTFSLSSIPYVYSRWINESYSYWNDICKSSEAALAGVAQLSAYMFSSTNAKNVRVSCILNYLFLVGI